MKRATIALPLVGLSGFALASPKIQDITTPFGGYATALAGQHNGGGSNAGDNLEAGMLAGKHSADWEFFTSGPVTASTSYSDASVTANGYAYVGLGIMKLSGDNVGTNAVGRYGGGSGGWIDTLTIDAAGLTGTAGKMVYTIHVDGTEHTTGFSGAAGILIAEYKNDGLVPRDSIFNSSNPALEITTDRQMVSYGLASDFSTENRTVDSTITFSMPFTYGTAFEWGVFARAIAGFRSTSGVGGLSSADIDFANTIRYTGLTGILDASGQTVTNYQLLSASGMDWRVAAVPEPGTIAGLGLGLTFLMRRRRR